MKQLTLDVGIASIGWAIVSKKGNVKAGSRIFPDAKSGRESNQSRRAARLMRRGYRRKAKRRADTLAIIRSIHPGFDPEGHPDIEREALIKAIITPGAPTPSLDQLACAFQRFAKSRWPQYSRTLPKRTEREDQFIQVWVIAERTYPDRFTPDVATRLLQAIFFQRPIKDGDRAKCQLFRHHGDKAPLVGWTHEPELQRFAILSDLSNLTIGIGSTDNLLCEYPDIIEDLETRCFETGMSWREIAEHVKEVIGKGVVFRGIDGQKKVGRNGIGPAKLETIDEEGNSTKSTASMSVEAAVMIYHQMKADRCRAATAKKTLIDAGALSAPLTAKDIKRGDRTLTITELMDMAGRITDPTIRAIYHQVEMLVNELIARFGKPERIVIEAQKEIGRSIEDIEKAMAREREKHIERQRENRARNAAMGTKARFARLCAIRGDRCFISDRPAAEVGHLIADSIGGTLEMANLIPIDPAINKEMGNRTPYEAFRKTEYWSIIQRKLQALEDEVKALKPPKGTKGTAWTIYHRAKHQFDFFAWRFQSNARETHQRNFRPGSLDDLRWIENLLFLGVAPICDNIRIVSGRTTERIRREILGMDKDRRDHRHHALDALAIMLANPLKPWDLKSSNSLGIPLGRIKQAFADAVVSQKQDHSLRTALHKENAIPKTKRGAAYRKIGTGASERVVDTQSKAYCEVWALPNGKWEAVVVSSFDAAQKNYRQGIDHRPHPAARLVMRLFKSDLLGIGGKIYRVQELLGSGSIYLVDHRFAGTIRDARAVCKTGVNVDFFSKGGDSLRKAGARLVSIRKSWVGS
ncbi:MAG: hypothetical protein ISN29_09125 [Gammaproteobacteria bacterium AqS3]|nr:hypothetical protein [Gammaproteobacteria bacterium AqS3]